MALLATAKFEQEGMQIVLFEGEPVKKIVMTKPRIWIALKEWRNDTGENKWSRE